MSRTKALYEEQLYYPLRGHEKIEDHSDDDDNPTCHTTTMAPKRRTPQVTLYLLAVTAALALGSWAIALQTAWLALRAHAVCMESGGVGDQEPRLSLQFAGMIRLDHFTELGSAASSNVNSHKRTTLPVTAWPDRASFLLHNQSFELQCRSRSELKCTCMVLRIPE